MINNNPAEGGHNFNIFNEIANQSHLSHIIWCEKWIAFCCTYFIFQILVISIFKYYLNLNKIDKLNLIKYIGKDNNKLLIHYTKKNYYWKSKNW